MKRTPGKPVHDAKLTFTTTIVGDVVRCSEGEFVVTRKVICERFLELAPRDHPTHLYPRHVSEHDYNEGGFTLVKGATHVG